MNNDGLFGDITRVDLPIGEKDNNAPDMLMVGDDLFTLYINFDNSHDEYYAGVAVQKDNLKTRDQERIYSHDELYDNDCGKHLAGGSITWFPWLHYEDGFVMPRNSCSVDFPEFAEPIYSKYFV